MTYDIRLDGSPSTGPEGVYLVWHRQGGRFQVQEAPDLENALLWFSILDSMEYMTPWEIEGPAGLVPDAVVDAWTVAHEKRAEAEKLEESRGLIGRLRHSVQIRRPDSGEVSQFRAFDDLGDAVAALGRLPLPADRVRVALEVFDGRRWVAERTVIEWGHEQEQAA